MKIKILGTRGEIKESVPYHSKQSGVLIDDKIMLDCGEQNFLKLDPQYILITHLHPDHAFFVRGKGLDLKIDAKIYAPEKFKNYDITITNKPFKIKNYKITPISTVHSVKVKSNAYLIEHDKKKILYTGDMIWINNEFRHLIKKPDLVITEASFYKTGGMIRRNKQTGQVFGHTGVPNLVKIFKEYADKILFIHFGSWFYKDMKKSHQYFKKLAKENNIEIIVGYDGLELNI